MRRCARLGATAIVWLAILSVVVEAPGQPADASGGKPVVYLTFDDGPDNQGNTRRIVDILDHYNAVGTFFMMGVRVQADPATVRYVASHGHALGNHTYDHRSLPGLSNATISWELDRTQALVRQAGVNAKLSCYRPPYGATSSRVRLVAATRGHREVKWDIDTNDWRSSATVGSIQRSLDEARHGSVVLMHDGATRRFKTVQALSSWMARNHDRFDFRAVPQCSGGVVAGRPFGRVEAVSPSTAGTTTVRGWTLDPDTTKPIRVRAYVNGRYATGTLADTQRNDVDAAHHKGPNHGFTLTIPAQPGNRLCIYAINNSTGPHTTLRCTTIAGTRPAPTPAARPTGQPFGRVEAVSPSTAGTTTVRGWTLDPDTTKPIRVRAYVNGRYATGTLADTQRNDVDAAHHKGPNHGFTLTIPAQPGNRLCIYAINNSTGPHTTLRCTTIAGTRPAPTPAARPTGQPFGRVEAVSPSTAGTTTVRGWTLDPDTTKPIRVRAYVNGRYATGTLADTQRNDVDAAHHKGPNHGFTLTIPAQPGNRLCIYAINNSTGPHTTLRCTTIR